MPVLHIDLRDGFHDDDVVLYVGGQEAARRQRVTTDLTISHAASIEVNAPAGPSTVRIEVPKQRITSSIEVDAAETPFVAVFLGEGKVTFHKLKEPLPML